MTEKRGSSFRVLLVLAAIGCSIQGTSHAQMPENPGNAGTCCWVKDPGQPEPDPLPGRFSATVTDVKKSEERLILHLQNREEVRFQFDSSIGTQQQRQLLDQVRPGDQLEGTRMNVRGSTRYHFDSAK